MLLWTRCDHLRIWYEWRSVIHCTVFDKRGGRGKEMPSQAWQETVSSQNNNEKRDRRRKVIHWLTLHFLCFLPLTRTPASSVCSPPPPTPPGLIVQQQSLFFHTQRVLLISETPRADWLLSPPRSIRKPSPLAVCNHDIYWAIKSPETIIIESWFLNPFGHQEQINSLCLPYQLTIKLLGWAETGELFLSIKRRRKKSAA